MTTLHIVAGRAGSGKSTWLHAQILARARQGKKSLLLVPEQYTSATERTLYAVLGDRYARFVESHSFATLAEQLLRRYGGSAVPRLSEAGRVVLARRAMDSLPDEALGYYSRLRGSVAFCEKAAVTFEDLQNAGVDPEVFAGFARLGGEDTRRLASLAALYSAYDALQQGASSRAASPAARLRLAAQRAQQDNGAFFAGTAVFIDEFDSFNAAKRELIRAMLPAADVTVALCLEPRLLAAEATADADGPFAFSLAVLQGLARLGAELGEAVQVRAVPELQFSRDLRHLPENGGSPLLGAAEAFLAGASPEPIAPGAENGALQFLGSAKTRREEARRLAAAARALAERGSAASKAPIPYSEMAVICSDMGLYLADVRHELRLQGIPFFVDLPAMADTTRAARCVLAALDLLGSLSTRSMLDLVKTGLVGLAGEEALALENYAWTWKLSAADWRAPFTRPASGYSAPTAADREALAAAERARAALIAALDSFRRAAAKGTALAISRAVFHFLASLGAEERVLAEAKAYAEAGDALAAAETRRAWEAVMGLLDEMVRLLGPDEGITAREYRDLFALLCRSTELAHIPQQAGSLLFTTADRMRLPHARAVFVLGLVEGEFPPPPAERGLLTHADCDLLARHGAELALPDFEGSFENRWRREELAFYKALSFASETLWLSCPGGEDPTAPGGLAAGRVSSSLLPLLRAFGVRPLAAPDTAADLAATPAAALEGLGREGLTPAEKAGALLALQAAASPTAAAGLAARRAAEDRPLRVQKTAPLARLLEQGRRTLSPTGFETFMLCPFRYFMQSEVRVRPRRKAELAADITGVLVHAVLERALGSGTGQAFAEGSAAFLALGGEGDGAERRRALAERADSLLREAAAEASLLNDAGEPLTAQIRFVLQRIAANLTDLLLFLQDDLRQSAFSPCGCEVRIGTPDEAGEPGVPFIRAASFSDDAGHTMSLVGKIDRVDLARAEDGRVWVRVVDYKTGSKTMEQHRLAYGIDCQMLLYLYTVLANGSPLTGAAPGLALPGGIEYLKADPAQASGPDRAKAIAQAGAEGAYRYELDGLVLDERAGAAPEDGEVLRRMDPGRTGCFSPIRFKAGGGGVQNASLARLKTLEEFTYHRTEQLPALLSGMVASLYEGDVRAAPLVFPQDGGPSPCAYCDYRPVCRHVDGRGERRAETGRSAFRPDTPAPKEENDG